MFVHAACGAVCTHGSLEVGMFLSVGGHSSRSLVRVAAALAFCASGLVSGTASAQSTVVLEQPGTEVTDTTIRNGSYANTNFNGGVLITRASADPEWQRRALLKFDTKNTIPEGTRITSATLTLTVKSGLGASGATT